MLTIFVNTESTLTDVDLCTLCDNECNRTQHIARRGLTGNFCVRGWSSLCAGKLEFYQQKNGMESNTESHRC